MLPDFEVTTVRAPFSAGLQTPAHRDWHAALDDLERGVAATDFDVCLVGAGAWSLPLCAFVRRTLKRPAVHLGGGLQLLFGIRGKRWEAGHPLVQQLWNEGVDPSVSGGDAEAKLKNDGGAYW